MNEIQITAPEIVTIAAAPTIAVPGSIRMEEVRSFFDSAFTALGRVAGEQGLPVAGAFGLYHGRPVEQFDLEVGFVVGRPGRADGEVRPSSLPAGTVARAVYTGGYDGLHVAWSRLAEWIAAQGRTTAAQMWEVYLTEPSPDADPDDMRTELNWLLAD